MLRRFFWDGLGSGRCSLETWVKEGHGGRMQRAAFLVNVSDIRDAEIE